MGCVVDHLAADLRVRVVRAFHDATGALHRAGERGLIRALQLDWQAQELVLEWEREGQNERLRFQLGAQTGPRNGHMRDYFAIEGVAARPPLPTPAPTTPARSRSALTSPGTLITEPKRYAEAVARIGVLAAMGQFEEAAVQIRVILEPDDPYGGTLERLAEDLVQLACASRGEMDAASLTWLDDRALGLWYAWGSQATSGGEGAARAGKIRAAEARLARR